jgi:hypothetical protein
MTLSVLMYAMMLATFVVLAGVLVVDAVRGLSQRFARRATDSAGSPRERSRAAGARDRRAVPTR